MFLIILNKPENQEYAAVQVVICLFFWSSAWQSNTRLYIKRFINKSYTVYMLPKTEAIHPAAKK